MIDLDLSQSLVVTDPFGTPSYKLNPVLHIVRVSQAATINGKINQGSFIAGQNAKVTVFSLELIFQEGSGSTPRLKLLPNLTQIQQNFVYTGLPPDNN